MFHSEGRGGPWVAVSVVKHQSPLPCYLGEGSKKGAEAQGSCWEFGSHARAGPPVRHTPNLCGKSTGTLVKVCFRLWALT